MKRLPDEYYNGFLSDLAKERKPTASRSPFPLSFSVTLITNMGISSKPISTRKNARSYLLACWQAKRVYLSIYFFEFQRTFSYPSRWRIYTHNWWDGTWTRPSVRRYRWIEIFTGLDTRIAGTKSRTKERRRLEDIHWFGVAGSNLQGQFPIKAHCHSQRPQRICCNRQSIPWLTQANLCL